MTTLVLFETAYPVRHGNPFLDNELLFLARAFDRVLLVSCHTPARARPPALPANCTVVDLGLPEGLGRGDKPGALRSAAAWGELLGALRGPDLPRRAAAIFRFHWIVARARRGLRQLADELARGDTARVVLYSYWLSIPAACALQLRALLRARGIAAAAVSRAHGYDVYAAANPGRHVPGQRRAVRRLDAVYPCSRHGEAYLRARYPARAAKIACRYLGVHDGWGGAYPERGAVFTVASCSNIIPLKRVHLIVEALALLADAAIHWVHFGDGALADEVQALAARTLGGRLTFAFPGRVSNAEVFAYYRAHPVNLFLNVSASEGLPVSIMEALCCGIPVAATAVGGTPEAVRDGVNGVLLPGDLLPERLAQVLRDFMTMPDARYAACCRQARSSYEAAFCADDNYAAFVDSALLGRQER